MLVVYAINAAIAYLSYLEAKRVGQVSLAWMDEQVGVLSLESCGGGSHKRGPSDLNVDRGPAPVRFFFFFLSIFVSSITVGPKG